MEAKWCIATYCRPNVDFAVFVETIRKAVEEGPCKLLGYVVGYGRDCYNHGIMLSGNEQEQERFINRVTEALMPAKYSRVSEDDPAVNEGQFINYLEQDDATRS